YLKNFITETKLFFFSKCLVFFHLFNKKIKTPKVVKYHQKKALVV
ncbi:unnamed protein product, partial [Staurois parvus]